MDQEHRAEFVQEKSEMEVLYRRLKWFDDVALETLCLVHFPEVADRFSRGLRRDEKINLILEHCHRVGGGLAQLRSALDAPETMLYGRNPGFVGRERELAQLHEMLIGSRCAAGTQPVGIVGLGGMGKTALAVEYAFAYHDSHPDGVFWINAAKPLLGEFAELAKALDLERPEMSDVQAAYLVWAYLNERPDALVVFDNVEDPALLVNPVVGGLIPANLNCYALFTTRWKKRRPEFPRLVLKTLPERSALALLLRDRPEVLDEGHPEHYTAQIICASFGWLPLALELAAAYLAPDPELDAIDGAGPLTLAGYLERLETEGRLETVDDTELRPKELPTRHVASVRATLQTHWNRLEDEQARHLFRVIGRFPEGDWVRIACLALLTGIAAEAGPGRRAPMAGVLDKLRTVSLVEELTGGRLRLHPLVHEFARELTPEEEGPAFREAMEQKAIDMLAFDKHRAGATPAVRVPTKRALAAGECLLGLPWTPTRMRPDVLDALREVVRAGGGANGDGDSGGAALQAASLLTRLKWLADGPDVLPGEMVIYLNTFGRYIRFPDDQEQVVEAITPMLALDLGRLERGQLLLYKASMLAKLGKIGTANQDYRAARALVEAIARDEGLEEEVRSQAWSALARILLGLGHIATVYAEGVELSENQERRQELLDEAVELYRGMVRAAQTYGHDSVLLAQAYQELGYAYALVSNWAEAEENYHEAQVVLKNNRAGLDAQVYAEAYAEILNVMSHVRWLKGQWLSLPEYVAAYEIVGERIKVLQGAQYNPLGLSYAHYNAGEYLLSMHEAPGCPVPNPMKKACYHWRKAREIARRLGMSDWEQAAAERLRQYCPEEAEGSGGAPEGGEEP